MPIEIGLLLRLGENALRSHRPRCLDSRGVLFSANERDPKSEFFHAVDDFQGWRGLFAQGLEIIPVSGDHLSMIRNERHQPGLAAAIQRALTTERRRLDVQDAGDSLAGGRAMPGVSPQSRLPGP